MNTSYEKIEALNSHFTSHVLPIMRRNGLMVLTQLKDVDATACQELMILLYEAAKVNKYVRYIASVRYDRSTDSAAMDVVIAFIEGVHVTSEEIKCSAYTILSRKACDLLRAACREKGGVVSIDDEKIEAVAHKYSSLQVPDAFESYASNLRFEAVQDLLRDMLSNNDMNPRKKICWLSSVAELNPREFEALIERKDLVHASADVLNMVNKIYGVFKDKQVLHGAYALLRDLEKKTYPKLSNKMIGCDKSDVNKMLRRKFEKSLSL